MREEVVGQPTCHVPHPGDGWLGADSTYCGAAVLKAQSRRPKTSGSGSGVRLGCTVCEWCYTRKNEDTGHESANISRDIPQCWPMLLRPVSWNPERTDPLREEHMPEAFGRSRCHPTIRRASGDKTSS